MYAAKLTSGGCRSALVVHRPDPTHDGWTNVASRVIDARCVMTAASAFGFRIARGATTSLPKSAGLFVACRVLRPAKVLSKPPDGGEVIAGYLVIRGERLDG